jgi:hypothetical protein
MVLFIIVSVAYAAGVILDLRSSLGKRELMPFFQDGRKIFWPVRYVAICAGFWVLFFCFAKFAGMWTASALCMIPAVATRVFISIRNRKIPVVGK